MKNVKVLLRESVDDLGEIGDVIQVAPGFARNYLFPFKKAIEATPENVKMMDRKRQRHLADVAARESEITAKLEALGQVKVVAKEKADGSGSLYGSVGAARIAELLTAAGHPTNEKDVRLDEPIKSLGTHEVPIHVFGEHYAGIQIVVEADATA